MKGGVRKVLSAIPDNRNISNNRTRIELTASSTAKMNEKRGCNSKAAIVSPSFVPSLVALRVSVSDTGCTEVTLEENHLPLVTPKKTKNQGAHVDDDPFLIEHTPDDSAKDTPMNIACGIYSCLPSLDKSLTAKDIRSDYFHDCILESLGNYYGHDWQDLLPSMADELEEEENLTLSPYQRRVLHNRAFHAKLKKFRLDKLRRDLHPFHHEEESSKTRAYRVSSTLSTSSYEQTSASSQNIKSSSSLFHHKDRCNLDWEWVNWDSQYSTCGIAPSSVSRNLVEVDENACYDSDPEDYYGTRGLHQKSIKPLNLEHPRSNLSIDHYDERAMEDLIQSVFRQRWTFILYPEFGTPIGIEAWLERGQRLQNMIISPKFVWLPVHEKSNKSQTKRTESNFQGIDLLDVQRILHMNRVDRKKFSLAKPSRTFLIKSIPGDYCLESRSTTERDAFVNHIKLAVARFGSLLVANDNRVEDFFVPQHSDPRFGDEE